MDSTAVGIISVVSLFVFGGLIFAGIKRQNKAFPKAALRQSYKNAIITILILYAVLACVVMILYFVFKQPYSVALPISLISTWIVVCFFIAYTWLYNKKKAGDVLLDIMPFPNKILFILFGCGAIAYGFIGDYSFGLLDGNYSQYVSIVISLSIGIFCFFMAFSRIQICEYGIMVYIDLITWEKIESTDWIFEAGKKHTLKFRYKGNLPAFMFNGVLPIPTEKKAEVDSILELYLSKTPLISNRAQ